MAEYRFLVLVAPPIQILQAIRWFSLTRTESLCNGTATSDAWCGSFHVCTSALVDCRGMSVTFAHGERGIGTGRISYWAACGGDWLDSSGLPAIVWGE